MKLGSAAIVVLRMMKMTSRARTVVHQETVSIKVVTMGVQTLRTLAETHFGMMNKD